VRRRWLTFVLVPLLALCCCGVPAVWLFEFAVDTSSGAPTPDGAAHVYLLALSYDNTDGLITVLDDDHQDELLEQWHAYRDAMKATDPPPFRLDYGALTVRTVADDRAEVAADVSARWWSADDNGRLSGYRSAEQRWRFETREDDGWQIVKVTAPAWCGDYVPPDKCG
jgi:hypothetical protein